MRLKWKLVLIRLEIVLILMIYRCTICTKHDMASKIIWTHPMELLGDVGHVECHLGPFGDNVSVGPR